MIVIKCSSHRARERLVRTLCAHGIESESVYDYGKSNHYGAYRINDQHRDIARSVKGVTVARGNPDDWGLCWSTKGGQ